MILFIFSYVSGPSACPTWRMSFQVLYPFFNWAICLLQVDSCEFFMYFGDQTLVQGIIGKFVIPYSWFSFHLKAVLFSWAQDFYFDEIPFIYSFLYVPCSRGHIGENIAVWNIWDFPAYVHLTFIVLWLIFKSFIHPEFIFVYGVSWWLSFFFFLHGCPDLPTLLVEETIFTPFYASAPFVNNWP